MYCCLHCITDRCSSVQSLATDPVDLRGFISPRAINIQQNSLSSMYHKLYSGSYEQKEHFICYKCLNCLVHQLRKKETEK